MRLQIVRLIQLTLDWLLSRHIVKITSNSMRSGLAFNLKYNHFRGSSMFKLLLFAAVGWILTLTQMSFAQDKLEGTFMEPGHVPTARIPQFFDELKSIGMDTVILSRFFQKSNQANGDSCSVDSWKPQSGFTYDVQTSKLTTILNEAKKRNLKVYVGLTASSGNCHNWWSGVNAQQTLNKTDELVAFLEKSYRSNSAYAGFYLTDEPPLTLRHVPDSLYTHFKNLVQRIRKHSQRPILVAPYLGGEFGVGNATPSQLAERAALMKQTGVTYQAWQDGVGADGRFSAADVRNYYQAISNSIGKNHLWSDIELFNGFIPIEPDTFGGTRNKPTIGSRLTEQISASSSSHVSKRVTWINSYFMSSLYFGNQTSKIERIRSSNAHRLFDAYSALRGIRGRVVRNANYSWLTRPDSSYPDSGNELFNNRIGAPKNFYDTQWTGIAGSAEAHIRFNSRTNINWVGAHVLNHNEAGIRIPEVMTVRCYTPERGWRIVDQTDLYDDKKKAWVDRKDGEFVFTNEKKLNVACTELRVRLKNSSWTFISELEIVSDAMPAPIRSNTSSPLRPPSSSSGTSAVVSNNTNRTAAPVSNTRLRTVAPKKPAIAKSRVQLK